jgi:hypothetical protein
MPPKKNGKFRFSKHALEEMKRRNIPRALVAKILDHPDQIVPGHGKSKVFQSQANMAGNLYLVRIVVGTESEPQVVVTVYRTSKVKKYWEAR